jgi:hypothetical protein
LLHALDPYGFAWLRRFDEENVDLNRNFLVNGQAYSGSPPGYAALDGLLNPPRPPGAVDLFMPRALLAVARHGMPALKSSVAQGQYDFPRGLFFGGRGPSRLRQVLEENLPRWVADARSVLHLDFHTGLGPWATYKLLTEHEYPRDRVAWAREHFGVERVEGGHPTGISYPTRGDIGTWCRTVFPGRCYDALCAEFGTYPPLRVVAALRAENQAHFYGRPDDRATRRAKRNLMETFVPASPRWRSRTVAQGLQIIRRGITACGDPSHRR